ncbi:hypothetical protein LX59_01572 [Azomonas agilis]|uniref:Toprim domain-containing protein n=1 Tax=Azomonas agilis TaxID=116849 RepID=A0A562IJV7_9GAMM|nr:hypothetical protein [Azomonas agilis]TWH71289.1 hypothetical protein LX59_01572 [Azomonas agilis]
MDLQNHHLTVAGEALPNIEPVARCLLGESNANLSKRDELRYGTNGSLSVDLEKNTYFDHEAGTGGGVLDLIKRETGLATRAEQFEWLEKNNLLTSSPASPKVLQIDQKTVNKGGQTLQIVTVYPYTDENGTTLYEVVRLEPKGFRQRKPDGKGGYEWSVKGVRQVPFHLPQLLAACSDDYLYIVEGEKDVLRLESLGLVATTNAGGAGKWPKELTPHFRGRKVIILPDNDESGRNHADRVRGALAGVAAEVSVLNLPNLPLKGDVSDWLDAGGTLEQLRELAEQAPVLSFESASPSVQGDEKERKETFAEIIIKFVLSEFEPFHDTNKEPYLRHKDTGVVWRLTSRQFRNYLAALLYRATERSFSEQPITEALGTLSAIAQYESDQKAVHIRTAGEGGTYYLDLGQQGNSRAVKVSAGRWEVTDAPAMFFRPEPMQLIPTPVRGGSIEGLWRIANVPEGSRLLVLAWLVECLRPDTPFPILELLGEHGSAKSSTQTALRRLIDPNACDLRAAPKTVEDIYVCAAVSGILSYENVSHLPAPMQDGLCIVATGGGMAKRKLYTDADESVISVKRPIVLNGISAAVTAQDLVDRCLTIEMPVIKERLEADKLVNQLEEQRPALLGALLDIAAKALALLPSQSLPPEQRPRLLEFALLGMAVAQAAGQQPEDFLAEFNASRQESLARTIDASPVATAVMEYLEANPRGMTASVKEIMATLDRYKPLGSDAWPRTAKGMGDSLRRAAPALRQLGMECSCLGKIGGAVKWSIKKK